MEYKCLPSLCCKHRNTFHPTTGRPCHKYMAKLTLVLEQGLRVHRTVCMPFLPCKTTGRLVMVVVEGDSGGTTAAAAIRFSSLEGPKQVVRANGTFGEKKRRRRRVLTLGWKELHVLPLVMDSVQRFELKPINDAVSIDRNLVTRKRPREKTAPMVVNLCAKALLQRGETRGVLDPGCARMQVAQGHTLTGGYKEGFEIGTTGKAILGSSWSPNCSNSSDGGGGVDGDNLSASRLMSGLGCDGDEEQQQQQQQQGRGVIRIVGTDDLYKTVTTLSHMCNIDAQAAPLVHMGIFCATLPHSTTMAMLRHTLSLAAVGNRRGGGGGLLLLGGSQDHRNHAYFYIEHNCCEDGMDASMLDVVLDRWDRFMDALSSCCCEAGQSFAQEQQALLQATDEEGRKVLSQTRCKVKVTHFGNVKIQLTWTQDRGGHLQWTQENTAVVNHMVTCLVCFFELAT